MTKETLLRLFVMLLAVAGGEVEVTEETETVECTPEQPTVTTYKQECMYIIIDIHHRQKFCEHQLYNIIMMCSCVCC